MIFKEGDKVKAVVHSRDVIAGNIYTVQTPTRASDPSYFALEESGYWQLKKLFKIVKPKNKPGVFE